MEPAIPSFSFTIRPCIDVANKNVGDIVHYGNTTITVENKNLYMTGSSASWAGMNPVRIDTASINNTYKNTSLVTPLSKSCKFIIRYM